MPDNNSGLSPEESRVLDSLVLAWNAFNAMSARTLPGHESDDIRDFRRAIHECQRIVAARAMKRNHPDYWNKTWQ